MCEKIQRHGFGCTNIGDTFPQNPTDLIPSTQIFCDRSKTLLSATNQAKSHHAVRRDGSLENVVEAVCPQPQILSNAREDTRLYTLRAIDINDLALMRPILCKFNQSGAHGILS